MMKRLVPLLALLLCLLLSAAAEKPLFDSGPVTSSTPGHAVEVSVKLDGPRLVLVIEDGGDYSCDHADWAAARLTGPKGELKLSDLDWKSATCGWRSVQRNRSVNGTPMRIGERRFEHGIGSHAPSVIEYEVPEGYDTFLATAGLDHSGTSQGGCGAGASVRFKVYKKRPKSIAAAAEPAAGATLVPTELFHLPEDLEIKVWATSPLLRNPTNIDVDRHGRVWVAEGLNYRGSRNAPDGDRVAVLSDTDGDGVADESHTFVQEKDFISPLGIAVIGDKVVVSQPPDLIVYTDTDGDAVFDPDIDKREVLLTGFDGRNHDHSLHSVTAGPGGQWYFNWGNKGADVTDREGFNIKAGSPYSMRQVAGQRSSDGHVYIGAVACRVNPDGTGLRPIGHNFRNSYEQTVTSFGDVFQNDNDDPPAARTTWLMEYGNAGFASADGQRAWRADKRWGQDTPTAEWRQEDPGSMPAGDVYGGGAPTGIAFVEGDGLGPRHRGTLLSCEPARNVVFGYKPVPEGAGFKLERFDFVTTNPENDFAGADFRRGAMGRLNTLFRPSDVCVGPDGAIYISDWFDARVGGHQTLDKTRSGTIYRVTRKGDKPTVPETDDPVALLRSPAVNTRDIGFRALLAEGESAVPAVAGLLDDSNPYLQARATWLLAQLGEAGIAKVEARLAHRDPQQVVCAFRALRRAGHKTLEHAADLAAHKSPAVRREAALALRDQPFERTKDIFAALARGYDGRDRWYLEALGYAAAGQEPRVYRHTMASLGSNDATRWKPAVADLAWRLHPASAIRDITAYATSDQPIERRRKMLVALGVMDDPNAAYAMVEIAKAGGEIGEEAKRWIDHRQGNLWKQYDPLGVLSGKPTPKAVYVDRLVPAEMGKPTKLPGVAGILGIDGDAARGRTLFARCIMCHKKDGVGVEFGPDLSTWGRTQPAEVVARGILDPDADISHGFDGVEVKTKSGKRIQGFLAAAGDPVIVRVFGGEHVSIDKDDVASVDKVATSWMIPASKMGLSAQDVADLVAYLRQ